MSEPTSVYLYYDRLGVLLYVGITKRGSRRQQEHNERAEWWPFVAKQEIEHYDTRDVATARETMLIRERRPPFNQQQNPDHPKLRAAYLTLFAPRSRVHREIVARCGHCASCELGDDPEQECEWIVEGKECRICGVIECLYHVGFDRGSIDGYLQGCDWGKEAAWRHADRLYAPDRIGTDLIRGVIDGEPATDLWAAERDASFAEMERLIAELGLPAMVAAAAEPPF